MAAPSRQIGAELNSPWPGVNLMGEKYKQKTKLIFEVDVSINVQFASY